MRARAHTQSPRWETGILELRPPSLVNPELSKVLSSKPSVGQNIASHASSAARNSTVLFTFPVPSLHFFSFYFGPAYSNSVKYS